ncbi:importin-alpha export receptor [Savitreella phatthalungensis]
MTDSVVTLLRQTLDPSLSKQAESALKQAETGQGFATQLLQIVSDDGTDLPTRQAAALFFKNYIRRNWAEDDVDNRVPPADRQLVKDNIVGFMTKMPPSLQIQVGEAVTTIASTDFPAKWEGLIDDLVRHINPNDTAATNAVLQTAHSIFKRWRAQFRSDSLFLEIKFVLDRFCQPYLALVQHADAQVAQAAQHGDARALEASCQQMLLLTKVFFDLNCQDIPEFFEDHLANFMDVFHKYLTFASPLVDPQDEVSQAGVLQRLKASICEIVALYTQRYEEVFTMLSEFVNTTWTLLTQLSQEPKNDILASKALGFLTSVVRIERHAHLFSSDDIQRQFIELIVLPNMSLREADEELFEDDPIEFIRRDLEGSDSDTRRRAASEFVRALVEKFEAKVTGIVLSYVKHYLDKYAADTSAWRDKDTAMYLVSSVAVKGYASRVGVTSTNLLVDVVDFFNTSVLPDLQAAPEARHPILKVDAIKYIHTFRNQLTKQQISGAFPLLAKHLTHPSYVVYTYAAVTVDALLTIKRDGQPLFTKQDVAPLAEQLLSNLFGLIEKASTPEKLAENDFLMRCVMRTIVASAELIAPATQLVLDHLTRILTEVSKNPSNPQFNHYLFESIGAIVKFVGSISQDAVAQLQSILCPPLLALLSNDVTEFIPYAFQLLAQLLELHQGHGLPPSHAQLLRPILTPTLWDSRGNVPALVRLVEAFVRKGSETVVAEKLVEPILGVFQQLIASRANDHFGFQLIETCYAALPQDALGPYNNQIFVLLLTRLNSSRTEKFTSRFIVFFCFVVHLRGLNWLTTTLDSVQQGLLPQLLGGIVLPNAQKLVTPTDVQTASVGFTDMLFGGQDSLSPQAWQATMTASLKLLELPAIESKGESVEDLLQMDLDDSGTGAGAGGPGFQASFAKLSTARPPARPIFADTADPKAYLASRAAAALQQPATATEIAQRLGALPQDAQHLLSSYGVQSK